MPTVPKIVHERLKAAESVGNHPDANLLTAFAEQAVTKPEREVILAHLAKCGDCRDIVALALPDSVVTTRVIVPARQSWLTWPALRWGLVAAGVVVVASFGVMEYQRSQRPQSAALQLPLTQKDLAHRSEAPATTASSDYAPATAAPAVEERTDQPSKSKKDLELKTATPLPHGQELNGFVADKPAAATVGGPISKQYPGGPKAPVQWQNNMQNTLNVNAAPPVALAQPKQEAWDLKADKTNQAAPPQLDAYAYATPQPAAAPARSSQGVDKAKAPVTVEATSEAVAVVAADSAKPQELPKQSGYGVNGRNFAQLVQMSPSSGPRWTISPTGALQRSLDQGNTWQDVDVTAALVSAGADAGPVANVAGGVLAKESTRERDSTRKASKRQAANPSFRTVTAFGTDVWAGGVGGALYHSQDAGLHWMRVIPSADGNVLTGDVLSFDFADAQHGRITTSTPEVWITASGGQTWQKQ